MGIITTNNPKGAGRPTDLTEDLFKEIKKGVLDGKTFKEIASIIGKTVEVFYVWHSDNYLGLADKIEGWKRDRKVMLASGVIDEMLEMPVNVLKWEGRGEDAEQVVTTDSGLVRIKQDTAKFVLETLAKDNYSKRSELTGKDGEQLMPKPLLGGLSNQIEEEEDINNNENVPSNDSDKEIIETEEKD